MTTTRQHHIQCEEGDVARIVLLPGDPKRSSQIADYLDDRRHVATNREYTTHTGTWSGVPVSVMSTGIGGPSVAIGVEELVKIGADTLIRVGTSGSMQPDVVPGDIVLATSAIRDEGTSQAYLPLAFPAVADAAVTHALSASFAGRGRAHLGVVHSKDSFYAQKEPQRMPIATTLEARWNAWVAGGALASEMEAATLFIVASVLGVRAATACLVASSHDKATRLTDDQHRDGLDLLITGVLDGAVAFEKVRTSAQSTTGEERP